MTTTPPDAPAAPDTRRAARASAPGDPLAVLVRRAAAAPWDTALWVLAGVHVLAVAVLTAGGGLFVDDLRAQAYAAGRTWWPFVVESNGTHLAPGARTVDWLMASYAPLSHWPAVVVTVLVAAGYALTVLTVVRLALRDPAARVLGAGWMLFVAALVPTYAWFRQALTTMLPLTLVLLAGVLLVRWLRDGDRRALVGAVAAHAVALTFSERALAVPVVVAALVLVVRTPAGGRQWRRGAAAVVPTAAANLVFLAAYAGGDFDRAERATPGVLDAAVKVGRWVAVDLVPQLLGGPVSWRPGIGAYSLADTPAVLVVVAWALLAGGLVALARTPRALRSARPVLLVALAYAVPVLTMVYVGRLAVVDTVEASDDLRLLPDVTVVTALSVAALVDATRRARTGSGHRSGRARRLVAGVVVLAVVLGGLSWVRFGTAWHRSTVPGYLDALRTGLGDRSGQVLPGTVPTDVVPGWVDPAFTTASLVRLLDPDAVSSAFDGPGVVVDASGDLVEPRFGTVASASVPDGFCGYVVPAGERSLRIPLDEAAPYFRGSLVQLGILVGDAERLGVRVVGRDGTVSPPLVPDPPELLRGPHRVLAEVPPDVAVSEVLLDVVTGNTDGVCVTSAQVLTVEAAS